MRLGRLLIIFAIAVILILGVIYALSQLSADEGEEAPSVNMTDIVIVVQPVSRGAVIPAEALGYLSYPTEQTIANMFTRIEDVAGMQARYDLEPGVVVTNNMVISLDEPLGEGGSDSALLIPAGMVAFPIPIDRFSSMAYGLRDGDHVNVIATMLFVDLDLEFQTELPNNTAAVISPGGNAIILNSQEGEQVIPVVVTDERIDPLVAQVATGGVTSPEGRAEVDPILGNQPFYLVPSEAQRARPVSQTLLQDVVILHVGNFLYTDENGEVVENAYEPRSVGVDAEGQPIPVGPKAPPDVVTLIVTPQDAVTLNYLLYVGADLTLALRSSGDDSIVNTEALTLEYLLNAYNIPVPSRLPFGPEPRLDSLRSPTEQLAPQENP